MSRLAIIADIHLHDLHGGYGFSPDDASGIALRTFEDTRASTRVFNESEAALLAILDDIAGRSIHDVALLGDQTDDGQPGAYAALEAILERYEKRHGLRFYATLGNHDAFGPEGKHQSKWLTGASGAKPVLVSSDPAALPPARHCAAMRGLSTREAIMAMARWGFMRPAHAPHWETPFGTAENLDLRTVPESEGNQIDASYLVEPNAGLWLLMIDANMFSRPGQGWLLHADAAWDHLILHRAYLLHWIADVVGRAQKAGKALVACSHYPMVPFTKEDGLLADEADIRIWNRRLPTLETAHCLAQTGLKLHFSGHMHIGNRTRVGALTNIAVPSPVAHPGGYLVVDTEGTQVSAQHVALRSVPGFDVAFPAYRRQMAGKMPDCLDAGDYANFLARVRLSP